MTTITTNVRESATVEINADELEQLRRRAAEFDRIHRENADRAARVARLVEVCKAESERLDAFVLGLGYFDEDGGIQFAELDEDVPEGAGRAEYWDDTDALAEQYIYNGYGELDGVRYMLEMSPVRVWLDTETGDVEAYAYGCKARYPMSLDAVDWLNEWAESYGAMSR